MLVIMASKLISVWKLEMYFKHVYNNPPCFEDALKSSTPLLLIKVKIKSYFSAARKIPDAQSALNSGSHESRK